MSSPSTPPHPREKDVFVRALEIEDPAELETFLAELKKMESEESD